MMKVKIQISTSTKNSTVNAVGNRNRRLGSALASSGRARVSVAMAHPCHPVVTRAAASPARPGTVPRFFSEPLSGVLTLPRVIFIR
jgi:hypothetical protein